MNSEKRIDGALISGLGGGVLSIISVFLPWFSATGSGSGEVSSININGLGSVSGSGMMLNLVGSEINWEFQGFGVLALGIASIIVALILSGKVQSLAIAACGFLIIGGGAVNLWSLRDISSFSGEVMGMTMVSGIGYGLYVVVIAGVTALLGGALSLRETDT